MAPLHSKIQDSIAQAIKAIADLQRLDGSFLGYLSHTEGQFNETAACPTIFPTALILSALGSVSDLSHADQIAQRAGSFLLSQRSRRGSLNYWKSASVEYGTAPYPDDLDDTFMAAAALSRWSPEKIDGTWLAQLTKLLIATETTPGGPYRTWLVPPEAEQWQDVDLAVNASVAYFLKTQDVELPTLTAYFMQQVGQNTVSSRYYPDPLVTLYYLARVMPGPSLYSIQNNLQAIHTTTLATPLQVSLWCSAWLLAGGSPDHIQDLIAQLLESQQQGLWAASGFYLDSCHAGQAKYVGCQALTTAQVVETLCLYLNHDQPVSLKKSIDIERQQQAYDWVYAYLLQTFGNPERWSSLLERVGKSRQGQENILLPYWVRSCVPAAGHISDQTLALISQATVYGWLAYTVYDNSMDGDDGVDLLPVANLSLQQMTKLFRQVVPNTAFAGYLQATLSRMETANAWELWHARARVEGGRLTLPSEGLPMWRPAERLAERSLGHSLAATTVLYAAGFSKDSPEVVQLEQFFIHYLTARQLSDEAHDWKEDLAKGHLTYVVSGLLQGKQGNSWNLDVLVAELDPIFWRSAIVLLNTEMERHIALAEEQLKSNTAFSTSEHLHKLLNPVKEAISKTNKGRAKALEFLAEY